MAKKKYDEKISLLRREAKRNNEANNLLQVLELYYPFMMDYPNRAPMSMINSYNRLVVANISDQNLRKKLLIKIHFPFQVTVGTETVDFISQSGQCHINIDNGDHFIAFLLGMHGLHYPVTGGIIGPEFPYYFIVMRVIL